MTNLWNHIDSFCLDQRGIGIFPSKRGLQNNNNKSKQTTKTKKQKDSQMKAVKDGQSERHDFMTC